MGMSAAQANSIIMDELDLPRLQLNDVGDRFTEEEVWNVIRSSPRTRRPGRMTSPPGSYSLRGISSGLT
jgi:hypothetical protein